MDLCLLSVSWSCTSFDDLPDELLVNIISRLPIKTIVQSTSVSKIWYSLIKNASFISAHLSRSISDPSNYYIYMFANYSPSIIVISDNHHLLTCHPDFIFPFETETEGRTLIGACNGLVCATDYSPDYHGCDIYLINPSINKYKKLVVESSCYADLIAKINNKIVYIKVGFGYCEFEKDYKVLRIINLFLDTSSCVISDVKVEIYSLKSEKWKILDVSLEIEIDICVYPVFVDGCLYWRVCHPYLQPDEYLLCFDLKDEVFSKIQLPKTYHQLDSTWRRCILDKNGSLAVVLHARKDPGSISPYTSICIFVLEKNFGGHIHWKELYYECADFNPLLGFFSRGMGFNFMLFSVLVFSGVGRLIFEGFWDAKYCVVAVDLDNSCAVEKLELGSTDLLDGATNVLESLVLFSDSIV